MRALLIILACLALSGCSTLGPLSCYASKPGRGYHARVGECRGLWRLDSALRGR